MATKRMATINAIDQEVEPLKKKITKLQSAKCILNKSHTTDEREDIENGINKKTKEGN